MTGEGILFCFSMLFLALYLLGSSNHKIKIRKEKCYVTKRTYRQNRNPANS